MTSWALVIDDDSDNRELLTEVLESVGHRVVSCGSGAEAVAIVDDLGKPAVVLSDVRLPDIHGPTLVAQMRTRPGCADLPAIFVTGVNAEGVVGLPDPVLVKPIDLDELTGLVSRHFGRLP
jgi:CheY-like chemotaxis protein